MFRCLVAALVALLALAPVSGHAQIGHQQVGIDTSNNALTLDGADWVPKCATIGARLTLSIWMDTNGHVRHDAFGKAEIAAYKIYGLDCIRMQVSQAMLDPQMPTYSVAYLREVESTAAMLRQAGLVVILSMQTQGFSVGSAPIPTQQRVPTNCYQKPPTSSTCRAWKVLAPRFSRDMGVMYEIFNEPVYQPTSPPTWPPGPEPSDWSTAWGYWQTTHQNALSAIRAAGAQNVLIAEGINSGKYLQGIPGLTDTLQNRLVWGIHAYPFPEGNANQSNMTQADFDQNWGVCTSHACIITEWALHPAVCHDGTDGNPTSPQIAVNLLTWVQAHKVGLGVWGFDFANTMFVDVPGWTKPTNFVNWATLACRDPNTGIGAMVRAYFQTGTIAIQ